MKRFLIRALHAAVFVVLSWQILQAQSASDGPKNPSPKNPSRALRASGEGAQDFVFLAEARPLLIRLHVCVDDKLLRVAWDDFMKHVFAYLDRNGDGVLSQQEAERAPQLGNNAPRGVNGFFNAVPASLKELDGDKDGKVTLAELSAYYRRKGFQPFQFQLDMSPPAGDALIALYMGGARPDPEVAAVSKAIFALLDTDKDGKLTQKEMDAAPALLLARDENEDEIITAQELVPEEKPKTDVFSTMMAMGRSGKGDGAGNRFVVPISVRGEAPPELVRRMQERYDPSAAKAALKPMQKISAAPAAGKTAMKMEAMPKPPPKEKVAEKKPAAEKDKGKDSKKNPPLKVSQATATVQGKDKGKDSKNDPPCKLTRKQLGLDEATFARLDANKDGVLDNTELPAFVRREPDLCLVLSFGDKTGRPLDLVPAVGHPSALAGQIHVQDTIGMLELGTTRVELRRAEDKKPSTNRIKDFAKSQFGLLFQQADKDNNGYIDEKEAKKSPFFGNIFKQMDRDGDGKVTEQEMLAFFDDQIKLGERAAQSCVTLVLRDQSRGLFDLLDTNRDGKLGLREIQHAPKLLAQWDRQGKGCLCREDIPPSYQLTLRRGPARPGGGNQEEVILERYFSDYKEEATSERGPAWFRKMDRNRDGDVSRKEFLFGEELFRKLDADGDGLISLEEAEKAGDLSRR